MFNTCWLQENMLNTEKVTHANTFFDVPQKACILSAVCVCGGEGGGGDVQTFLINEGGEIAEW